MEGANEVDAHRKGGRERWKGFYYERGGGLDKLEGVDEKVVG